MSSYEDAKPLKKKERLEIQDKIIKEQSCIIAWLKEINSSPDPHSNFNENNILWCRIHISEGLIKDYMAQLNSEVVETKVWRPMVNGEVYSSADM